MVALRTIVDPLPARDGSPAFSPQIWMSLVGSIGFGMASAALGYLSYALSHSLIVVLIVSSVRVLPSAVLIRPVGQLLSRYDIRIVMVCARSGFALVFIAAAFITYQGKSGVIALIVVALLWGLLSAVSQPGNGRLIGLYVPKSEYDVATGAFASANGLGNVVGAALGGVLLMHTSTFVTFLVMGLLYVPAALIPLVLPRRKAGPITDHGMGQSVRASMSLVRVTPVLLAAVVCTIVLELFAWPILALLPRMAAVVTPNAAVFSAVLSGYFLGSALVHPVVRSVRRRKGYGPLLHATLVVLAIVVIVSALAGIIPGIGIQVALLTVAMVFFGLLIGLATSISMAAVIFGAPSHSAPSVAALYWAVIGGLGPVGALAFILLAQVVVVWWSVAVCAVLLLVVSVVLWARGSFREVSAINRDALCPLCAESIHLRIPHVRLWSDSSLLADGPNLMAREIAGTAPRQ